MASPTTIPKRPPPLGISKICCFKTVDTTSILLDLYLPKITSNAAHPVMLFIHGGGWAGSNRSDYCRPLFRRFLSLNFVVASMDYRLVPETSFGGQLEDVKDIEDWLKNSLQDEVTSVEWGKKAEKKNIDEEIADRVGELHVREGSSGGSTGEENVAEESIDGGKTGETNSKEESNVGGSTVETHPPEEGNVSEAIITGETIDIKEGTRVDTTRIVVVGASAGAHLAMFTPELWQQPPVSILSMYGPTDMSRLPHLGGGRLESLPCPEPTHDLLHSATTYSDPPTSTPLPVSLSDYQKPRGMMSLNIFRSGLIAEFLLRGLVRSPDGDLSLPEKGSVSEEEVRRISPLHLCKQVGFPPLYQVIGSEDKIFHQEQVRDMYQELKDQGREVEMVVVQDAQHAFDMWTVEGDPVDQGVLAGAVEWVVKFAGVRVD